MSQDAQSTPVFSPVEAAGLPTPVGPYSYATRAGELVFCSGFLALDPRDSSPLSDHSPAEQTRIVLDNLLATLAAVGGDARNVVRTTVYVADLTDYAEVNEVYREVFSEPYPARAAVEVKALIGGLAVEIDAIAVVPTGA